MASLLSLVITSVVVGTLFNVIDERLHDPKVFRPINSLMINPAAWAAFYVLALVAGGATILLNRWLDPWASVLLVTPLAFACTLWNACTEKGITSLTYVELARESMDALVFFPLLGLCTASCTLVLLSLIGG